MSVNDRREITRLKPSQSAYFEPAWFDEDRIVFTSNNAAMLANLTTGAIEQGYGGGGFVSHVMTQNPNVAYIWQDGSKAQLTRVWFEGSQPSILAVFQAGNILHAALSPDGGLFAS